MKIQTKNNDTTLAHIRDAICAYFGISVPAVVSAGKSEYFVIARKMIAWFGNYYGCTDSEIAELIGRDRTSIIYSRKWVSERISIDKHFRKMVRNIQFLIENPLDEMPEYSFDKSKLHQELFRIFKELANEIIISPTLFEITQIPKFVKKIERLGIKSDNVYRELYTFTHRIQKDVDHSPEEYIDRLMQIAQNQSS